MLIDLLSVNSYYKQSQMNNSVKKIKYVSKFAERDFFDFFDLILIINNYS